MSMSQSEEDLTTYKIILIGDSSVGKTCIFKKLTLGTYSDKNISTIGVDRKSFIIELKINEDGEEIDKSFRIQLWDTAGQERYRSITKGYYKDSQALLLIYDITNKSTFDNVDKWITGVKDSLGDEDNDKENSNYIIILLGNKLDLDEAGLRKINKEDAEEICKKKNIIWGGEISAKDITSEELMKKFETFTLEIFNKIGYIPIRTSTILKGGQNDKKKKKCC